MKNNDDAKKIIELLRNAKGAKVSSIEIEFEDPEEDNGDMKSKIVKDIAKQRGKKK